MRQQAIMAVMVVSSMLCGTVSAQEHAGMVMLEQGQPAPGPHHAPPVLDFKVALNSVRQAPSRATAAHVCAASISLRL
jgi:hypothetical protein